jgi:hypothetical protein
MKRLVLAVAILIAVPSLGQEVKRVPKLAELQALGDDFVSVDGFWEPDSPTAQSVLVPTATHIECYRHGGKVLVGTEAIYITASASAAGGLLKADSSVNSASWSNDEIVISDSHPICLISKTIFDLRRHTVTALDIRKPEAEGLGGACKLIPDRQTYYLRESVDYQIFHVPVKK